MIIKFVNMFFLQLDVSCHSSSVWGLPVEMHISALVHCAKGINSFLSIDLERNLCFTLNLSNFDIVLSFYVL